MQWRTRRRLLIALGFGAPALVVAAALLALAWLESPSGEELVRNQAEVAINRSLAGRVELGRLTLSGGHLTLQGLRLYTPEHERVADIERVDADVELSALVARRVVLSDLVVEAPKLWLLQDERGLNLARALGSQTSAKGGAPLRLTVRTLTLHDGEVSFTAPDRRVAFQRLEGVGALEAVTEPLSVEAELQLTGASTAPLEAPLKLSLTARSPKDGSVDLAARLELGPSHLEGRLAWPALEAQVVEAVVTPAVGRAFEPTWPLKVPLLVSGKASLKEGTLEARAGAAVVNASGAWTLQAGTVERFEVTAHRVNLAELLEGGKRTQLALTAHGSLSDAHLESLGGTLQLHGVWETPEQQRLAMVDLDATSRGGILEVRRLHGEAPGAALDVHGEGSRQHLALEGRLELHDLAKLSPALKELIGQALPPMSGSGALAVSTSGSLLRPGVALKGQLKGLRVASLSAEALSLDVTMADVTHPVNMDGVLSTRRVQVGERVFDEVAARVSTQGRALDAELTMKGLGDLRVSLAGTLDSDSDGLALTALSLKSPEVEWTLDAPSHLAWGSGLVVERISLHAGSQHLVVEGRKQDQRLEGHLSAERLDLARLPRALAPESLGLGGVGALDLKLRGRLPSPDVELTASWTDGTAQGLSDLGLELTGTYRKERAQGKVRVTTPMGGLNGDFDLPVTAWLERRSALVRAHLEVTDLNVQRLAALAQVEIPVTGVVSGVADVEGTTNEPKVTAALQAPKLRLILPAEPVLARPKVMLSTGEHGRLSVLLSAGALGGVAVVNLATSLTVGGLRSALPTRESVKTLPITASVELTGLDLSTLRGLGLTEEEELAGRLSVKGTVSGSLAVPRLDGTISLSRVATHSLRNLDVVATVKGTDDSTSLTAHATVKGRDAAHLDVRLDAPLERLQHPDELGGRPVAVTGTVYPFELGDLFPGGEGEEGTHGTAGLALSVRGTLDAPQVSARGSVQNLAFAKVRLGTARFDLEGDGRRQAVTLVLGGQGREDLRIHGTVGVELSVAAFRRGLEPAKTPLALDIDARALDVAFLSGVHELVRVVAGRLTMHGRVDGSLGAPRFQGTASLSQGRLALLGLGDYHDLQVELTASNDRVELSRLQAKAGAGMLTLKATATRQPSNAFHLEAEASADRFPIVFDDQLVATTSLRLSAAGELTDTLVDLKRLELPRVEVELPEMKRKDLQELQRPPDILVVRGGLAVSARQRREARERARSLRDQEEAPGLAIRAVISAPRNLWVRSSDVNVELGLSDGFRVERAGQLQMFGEAEVLRGRLNVLGREFEIQRDSQLRFAGSAKDPYVNVTAIHSNQREQVKVTATVVGKGAAVTLKVSSDPPMTESAIYTLLATGRRELRRDSGTTITPEQARSVVGNVAASLVKTVLAKRLPIDVLNFEATEDATSVRLNVGKYLSDSVYVGYSFQPGANESRGENQHTGRLELQLSRRWSLQTWAGTAPSAGADLMWSRDF